MYATEDYVAWADELADLRGDGGDAGLFSGKGGNGGKGATGPQ